MLLASGWQGGPRLTLLCGGEPFPPELVAPLLARCGALWNVYGPTETTIWSAVHRVTSPASGTRPPIGRPIANTQAYVVDRNLEPAPIGVPGELVIGGDGVALGYVGRPDLTAERFVPDGLGPHAGARVYRTGDRARVQASGAIEHLGRLDHQVKIRGHRIEPGEIEAILAAHPGVHACAVVPRAEPRDGGDLRLVAYVVHAPGGAGGAELCEHLRASLPEVMIPAAFVSLDALPLTPNGKVDRAALPAPEVSQIHADAFVEPAGHTETVIASIFVAVLRLPRVGAHASFFDLGGHSLLAMEVVTRIRAEIGADLPVRSVFEAPSVAALARVVEGSDLGSRSPGDLDVLLDELAGMSDEEAERRLAMGSEEGRR